jgi:hypothetical protein
MCRRSNSPFLGPCFVKQRLTNQISHLSRAGMAAIADGATLTSSSLVGWGKMLGTSRVGWQWHHRLNRLEAQQRSLHRPADPHDTAAGSGLGLGTM